MELRVGAAFGAVDGMPHLIKKLLVGRGMFFDVGESIAAQKALFAAEVHFCKFDQPHQLRAELGTAIAAVQLLAKLVQRVHQDSALVIHRFYADNERLTCNCAHSSSPLDPDCLSDKGGEQYRFRGGAVRPWFHIRPKQLFQNHFGKGLVTSCGQNDRGGEDQASSSPRERPEMLTEKFDSKDGAERRLNVEENPGPRCGHMVN